ncbi:MAG: NTP transferase domain-containing protein [Candidatus Accumulibacter sp.]|uniref:cytidylyltransferase domain-containing protein n=1 Tax=Accumulibacter sp. TaxID=2053492 RepID=UPI0025911453|nr:NTP transferase domain-containing protein [Accumulibacter sp.]MCM8622174.1 NTP transferase domain-containing protein [Accumulibacter sp.]
MTRTYAIVQARTGSMRFPGKMLRELHGSPVLEWVLRRVAESRRIDGLVLATSDLPEDSPLEDIAKCLGVSVFRGSESDVLGRFIGAAAECGAENIVRVCADNPFVDPREVDRLVAFFLDGDYDYACNHQNRLGSQYADGFGAEAVRADVLRAISRKATSARHREHVTLYVWDYPCDYRIGVVPAPSALAFPRLRFDVDSPDDLAYLDQLCQLGVSNCTSAAEIVRIALDAARCSPP